jgi:hypothetical protein
MKALNPSTHTEHLASMEALLPRHPKHYPRFLERNDRFHRALWKLSKSRMLIATLEGILRLPFAAPSAHVFIESASARTAEIGQEHHRRIVEAIASRAGTRAEALAREHSHIARRVIEHSLHDAKLSGQVPGATLISFSTADSRSHLTNGVPTRTRKHENAKTRNNLKVFFFVISCFRGFVIVRVYETRSSFNRRKQEDDSRTLLAMISVRGKRRHRRGAAFAQRVRTKNS